MVTAELAVGLLAAGLVAVLACWAVALVVEQTRCGDVAAQVARELARGDKPAAAAARSRAPHGADVQVTATADSVRVRVQVDERLGYFGPVHLVGNAAAEVEPGVVP